MKKSNVKEASGIIINSTNEVLFMCPKCGNEIRKNYLCDCGYLISWNEHENDSSKII